MIYLDNAASTPLLHEVKEKLISVLDVYGNPSSLHKQGIEAKKIIEESKQIIADKLHISCDEIYFTSGATMSNNIVLQGFQGDVFVSEIEHEDILMMSENYSHITTEIYVDKYGRVDLEELSSMVDDCYMYYRNTHLLFSIQAANSEIGTIQDIKAISDIIHRYPNMYLHMDVTQYIPYFELNVQQLKIDALSMSGQKIGCIKGIGMLCVSNTLLPLIKPLIYGAQGLIGGTENVLGIACLGEAFKQLAYDNEKMYQLRNKLIANIGGTLVGSLDNRLPNNVNVMYEGLDAQVIVALLNEHGVCCSAGSACSSYVAEPSKTLLAIGLTPEQANSCVRFTLGKQTTEKEINEAIAIINQTNNTCDFSHEMNWCE